jgi:hypothetical protein
VQGPEFDSFAFLVAQTQGSGGLLPGPPISAKRTRKARHLPPLSPNVDRFSLHKSYCTPGERTSPGAGTTRRSVRASVRRPPPSPRRAAGEPYVRVNQEARKGLSFPSERVFVRAILLHFPINRSTRRETVPYAGAIQAAGRTPTQVQAEIVKALANLAIRPQAEAQNISLISVLGEVNKADRFPAQPASERHNTRWGHAPRAASIARNGGFSPDSNRSSGPVCAASAGITQRRDANCRQICGGWSQEPLRRPHVRHPARCERFDSSIPTRKPDRRR